MCGIESPVHLKYIDNEPSLKHNTRHRARDHGDVPVLHPGAFLRRDRPVHRHPGSAQVQGEAPEPHPQKDGQQGDIISYRRVLRHLHRYLRALLPVVCHSLLLHSMHIRRNPHRRKISHRESRQGQEPSSSCSGNRHGYR